MCFPASSRPQWHGTQATGILTHLHLLSFLLWHPTPPGKLAPGSAWRALLLSSLSTHFLSAPTWIQLAPMPELQIPISKLLHLSPVTYFSMSTKYTDSTFYCHLKQTGQNQILFSLLQSHLCWSASAQIPGLFSTPLLFPFTAPFACIFPSVKPFLPLFCITSSVPHSSPAKGLFQILNISKWHVYIQSKK